MSASVARAGDEIIEIEDKAPEQTKPVSYELTADEIRELPGAGNDVLRAAQILPGVARIPYSFGGLVLRGMSPRDSAVYLDGVEVPLAFHFGGVTSFYPSTMLGDLSLVAGGFSTEYGRAQGGLVTLTTRAPRTDHWREGGSIGLLDSSVYAEGPVTGGGLIVGVRRSYFDTVAGPFVAADIPLPSYWDAQIKGSFGHFSPMIFMSLDRISTNDPSGNHGKFVSITSMFVRAAVPYVRTWGSITLHVVPWVGTDRLTFEDNDNIARTTESFTRPVYPGGVRADVTRDEAWGFVRGGIDVQGGYLSHSQIGFSGSGDGPQQNNGSASLAWGDLGLWVETRVKLAGERLAIKPGLRFDGFGLTHERAFDPRLNISQQLTDTWTLRQSIGRFHQPPTPADVDPVDGNPKLHSSYVDQLSLGIDRELGHTSASVTGFYNYGRGIAVPEPNFRPGDSYQPNLGGLGPTFELLLEKQLGFSQLERDVGRARSTGIEFLLKRSTRRWFGMIAYTLSVAERVDDPTRTQRGPSPFLWRPFELDQTHNLNVAGSWQLTHWRLGARVQLVSGVPYSPSVPGTDTVVQKPWAANLPPFFQLDVRADRRWHRPWGDINFYIDIQNATNRANVEGREYDDAVHADKDVPGLPIVPFLGVELIPK